MVAGSRRLVALLLVLISPAVGGTLLPFLHPCPVDAPWLAQEQESGHSSQHQQGHHGGGGHEAGQPCTCPGSGSIPSLTPAPVSSIAAIIQPPPRHTPWVVVEDRTGGVVLDLLPESTAPPRG